MRRLLIALALVIFLADLADDGRLGATALNFQGSPSHTCGFTPGSLDDHPLDLRDFAIENSLHWQKLNFLSGIGPGLVAAPPILPPLPERLIRVSSPVLLSWHHDPCFSGGGCGGLPS